MMRHALRVRTRVRAAYGATARPSQRGALADLLSTFLWIGALSLFASACAPDRPLAARTERPVVQFKPAASLAASPQLSAGYFHTCAVRTDQTLICWGGEGGYDYGIATPPSGTFTQVSVGVYHACAVRTDQTLACWGTPGGPYPTADFGQATPPSGTFTQVSSGVHHSCALKTDGTIACWGWNYYGQSTPPSGTFTQVSAGWFHTCALKTDRTLACWGAGEPGAVVGPYDEGQATPPPGTFTQVSSGAHHSCAVKTDETLACWGAAVERRNNYGQVTPPPGTFAQVGAGGLHNCALKTDGTLACWGLGWDGQTTPPTTGTFTQVAGGTYHSCAVKIDGTPVCWGRNTFGQTTVPSWNQPPAAHAGPDQTAEATSPAGASVALNGAGSSDADNDPLTYTWTGPFGTASGVSPTVTLPLGTHTVTLTVSDGQATSTDAVQITIQDTTAPETAITAANDGYDAPLSGGASTLSSAVTIAFGGSDAVGVTGFECSMDAAPYSSCTSPVAYSGLAVGTHVIRVRALDAAGNLDLSPASFTWAVITPSMATQNLITAIENMSLPDGTANSLTAPLGEVSRLLNDGNPNNDGAVCNRLDAFLNQVSAKTVSGQLTPAQAGALLQAVTAIKRSLGC